VRNVRNGGTAERAHGHYQTFLTSFPTFPTFLTFLTLLAACHSSPEEKEQKTRQQLASWEATTRLTDELARQGALPAVYVRQVREAAEQGKEQVREQAAKTSQ
jgi:hypothetical protein